MSSIEIKVRWGDMDAFGHVNNTAFMRYVEDARIDWLGSVPGGWSTTDSGPVVANTNINFRRELRFPATLQVQVTASAASERRLLMNSVIRDAADPDIVYADAEVTMVWVDFSTRRAVPLPRRVLDRIAAK